VATGGNRDTNKYINKHFQKKIPFLPCHLFRSSRRITERLLCKASQRAISVTLIPSSLPAQLQSRLRERNQILIFDYRFHSLKIPDSQGPAFLVCGFTSHSPVNLNYWFVRENLLPNIYLTIQDFWCTFFNKRIQG
jgi:hypothetical protein